MDWFVESTPAVNTAKQAAPVMQNVTPAAQDKYIRSVEYAGKK